MIEDLDGAQTVLYPLRELQSKKRITKTVVHKNNKGESKTIHLTVEGPVCVAGCTTQESIYEDNSNRSFLLYIDESQEQDIKIMNYQRLSSAGKLNKDDELEVQEFLQNVQRVLKPIKVINPFAEYLSLPSAVFKPRRTNSHYLQFIEAITFYKQYQRERKTSFPLGGNAVGKGEETGEIYIETTIEDIEEANELIKEVLLRKSDELNGATRNYLENVKNYLEQKGNLRFTASEIRRTLRIKKTTQWRYHKQLFDSYLIIKDKKKGENQTYYKLSNHNQYKELQAEISKALDNCIAQIKCSTVPECSTTKMEHLTKSKTAS